MYFDEKLIALSLNFGKPKARFSRQSTFVLFIYHEMQSLLITMYSVKIKNLVIGSILSLVLTTTASNLISQPPL